MVTPFQNHIERAFAILRGECDAAFECRLLLESEEPLGLPGFFFYSDAYGARFNAWKKNHSEGRHYWNHWYKELLQIDNHPAALHYAFGTSDPHYLTRWKREALRIPVPTTICLEALLFAGFWKEKRVCRAVNPLIALKNHPDFPEKDYACSCPTAKAELTVKADESRPDFGRFAPYERKSIPYFYAPLVKRALEHFPGFAGSPLALDLAGKTLTPGDFCGGEKT